MIDTVLNLGDLYRYIAYLSNKEQLGEPFTPENFNILLKAINSVYYREQYKNIINIDAASNIDFSVKLFNDTSLARFLSERNYDYDNKNLKKFDLPEDLYETISARAYYNNNWIPAEFLAPEKFDNRRFNILTKSPKRKPLFKQNVDGYVFVPYSIRRAVVNYLREANTPYFDYCIGIDDDNEYYMEPGSRIQLSTEYGGGGEEMAATSQKYDLVGADNQVRVKNVVYPQKITKYPYFSQSVELDWDKEDKIIISNLIVSVASIRSREIDVSQIVSQEIKR